MADDYAKVLYNATVAVQSALVPVVQALTGDSRSWSFCEYLNETRCDAITAALAKGLQVPLFLFNSLGWDRTEVVTVPALPGTAVRGAQNNSVSQLSTVNAASGLVSISFAVSVPALGWTTVVLVPGRARAEPPAQSGAPAISNLLYNLTFGGADGGLSSINGLAFTMNYLWCNASTGNKDSSQASGAYIMRPNGTDPFAVAAKGANLQLHIERGPVFQQARLTYSNWLQSTMRLYQIADSSHYVEIETSLRAIPIADGLGKEVVHRFQVTNFPF